MAAGRESRWNDRSRAVPTVDELDRAGTPIGPNDLLIAATAPAKSGWVELRIVRVGPSFILLSKYDGEAWQVRERFHRSDLPRNVQVGFNVYTGWNIGV